MNGNDSVAVRRAAGGCGAAALGELRAWRGAAACGELRAGLVPPCPAAVRALLRLASPDTMNAREAGVFLGIKFLMTTRIGGEAPVAYSHTPTPAAAPPQGLQTTRPASRHARPALDPPAQAGASPGRVSSDPTLPGDTCD